MVRNTTPVNTKSKRNADFGMRIVLERERLKFKQVDICIRTSVSKTTQIKYESGDRTPDIEYLAALDHLGFDVMFILTGERGGAAPLNPELQNLLEAYEASPVQLKRAVFGVLLSPYKAEWEQSRVVPGYFRHEVLGENDARFEKHHEQRRSDEKKGKPDTSELRDDERALLDNYRNASPENKSRLAEISAAVTKQVTGNTETGTK